MNKELAYRENNGLAVTLWWHSDSNRLSVSVHDGNTGDWFALNAAASVWLNRTSGLADWLATIPTACAFIAANTVGSARGAVKRR